VDPIPRPGPGGLGLRCRMGQTLRRCLFVVGRRVAERAVTADIFAAVAALPVVRGGEDPSTALDVVVDALDGRCVRGDHRLPRSLAIRSANQNLSRFGLPQAKWTQIQGSQNLFLVRGRQVA